MVTTEATSRKPRARGARPETSSFAGAHPRTGTLTSHELRLNLSPPGAGRVGAKCVASEGGSREGGIHSDE